MKQNFYIFTPGALRRRQNTLFFVPFKEPAPEEDENLQEEILLSIDSDAPETTPAHKRVLPIDSIEAFYLMAEATHNTRFLEFCSQGKIPIHYFNRYGFYTGSFYPREYLISGFLLVKQVEHYKNAKKRMVIARKFVEGAAANLLRNLKYYNSRERDLQDRIDTIESVAPEIDEAGDITELMNVEGRIRKIYYTAYNEIFSGELRFDKRVFNPPDNPVNALISFCNSLVYTTALSEIYRTQLDPAVSFLHQPGSRRFSLALDIAEIFKPILADRIIFKLINNRQIQNKHFEKSLNGCYLKENGRKAVVQEYDEKLKSTIKHRKLGRQISYRRLLRLECYRLIKHLTGDAEYEPFKIWQ